MVAANNSRAEKKAFSKATKHLTDIRNQFSMVIEKKTVMFHKELYGLLTSSFIRWLM